AFAHAHLKPPTALEEVQTTPPRSPQKALIAAVEFIYVIGVTPLPSSSVMPARTRFSQQSSTWVISAMSAMEHPAFRSGRIVACPGRERMSALSAIKCTPQNTMYFPPAAAACCESL